MTDDVETLTINQDLTLTVPKDDMFMLRDKDWARIRKRLKTAQQQRREYSAIGWALVGVFVSATFGAISWEPAYRAMPAELRPEFAWVWPAILSIGISAAVVGAILFWVSSQSKSAERISIQEVIDDMDEIRGPRSA